MRDEVSDEAKDANKTSKWFWRRNKMMEMVEIPWKIKMTRRLKGEKKIFKEQGLLLVQIGQRDLNYLKMILNEFGGKEEVMKRINHQEKSIINIGKYRQNT